MKLAAAFFLALTFSAWAASTTTVKFSNGKNQLLRENLSQGHRKILRFQLAYLELMKKEKWQQMKAPGLDTLTQEGSPELPYSSVILHGRPEDFELEIQLGEAKKVAPLALAPAPHLPCRCASAADKISWQRSAEKYAYWERPRFYELEYLGDFRGIALTKLSLFPVQYSWQKQEALVYPEMTVEIENMHLGHTPLFENFQQLQQHALQSSQRYLILAPQRWKETLAPFIAWKERLGFTIDLVDEETYGKSYTEIATFLEQRYHDPLTRFDYLLLVGDETIIPTNRIVTRYNRNTPTDLGLTTYGGPQDRIPDVFAGRLVANSTAHLIGQIQKWIEYEQGNFTDASGMSRGIGIASNDEATPSDLDYLKKINSFFESNVGTKFTIFHESNPQSTAEKLGQALNAGAMWLTYLGHGLGNAWSSLYQKSHYTSTHVAQLSPTSVRPFILDISCANGRFLVDPFLGGGYLGERFVNQDKNGRPLGATAYYGATVDITWHPPAKMAVGVAQELFAQNLHTLGEVLLAGQMYLATHHDNLSEVVENFSWFHLFGDPSLMVRVRPPKYFTAEIASDQLLIKEKGRPLSQPVHAFVKPTHSPGLFLWSNHLGEMELPTPWASSFFSILERDYVYLSGEIASQR